MSRSKTGDGDPESPQGERALQTLVKMMKAGRSWSGNERNCSFLNTGANPRAGGRFANISATSGLDFVDDARALALVDWDHDGRLDLWAANRSAPQLRLMRNRGAAGRYLALRLVGDGVKTTRDAIGARVEVVVSGQAAQIKTLRAGEGFLSQSSKWLHFGLGQADAIERVVVRWPGGGIETLEGLEPDRRYRVQQGSGKAEPVPAGDELVLGPGEPEKLAGGGRVRIPLLTPLIVPPETFESTDGKTVALPVGEGKPVLVNLWASWCAPCLEEMQEITDRERDLRAAEIEVVALSVDGIKDPKQTAKAQKILDRMGFQFQSGAASEKLVGLFQMLHDMHIPLSEPLPVPTSFLIDRRGRLSVIYKGRVPVDQILRDAKLPWGSLLERTTRAAPLPGRTIDHPVVAEPIKWREVGVQFGWARDLQHSGRPEEAERAYGTVLESAPGNLPTQINLGALLIGQKRFAEAEALLRRGLAQGVGSAALLINLGIALHSQQDWPGAIEQFRAAVQLAPESIEARQRLGTSLLAADKADEACTVLREALELDPGSARGHYLLASALTGTGETEPATERFLAAIRLAPDSADQAHFQLALLLRQSGEFEEAVTHLRQTVRLTPGVARAHYELANTYKALGDSKAALPELRHTVRLAPGFVPAVNDLAWLLATSSETALRDGGEALGLAKSLVGESGPRNHTSFDTMAAACAELGDFDAAVRWQRRAIRDCPDEVRAEYEARLRLYESQTPYRSSAL